MSTELKSLSTTFVCVLDNNAVPEVLLKSNVNLLFFGNQDTCTNIWKKRRNNNLLDKTFCVRLEYADLPDSNNETLRNILLEEGLYGQKPTDPESSYHSIVENWSQFFYLKRATELNPFETTYFCWLNPNIPEISEDNLERVNELWRQNILIKGFRIIQTGVVEEDIFLDARNFYNKNRAIVNDKLMGGTADEICSIFEKIERQKIYILKIKKVVLLYDILARISYFFNEHFSVIHTVDIINDNKINCSFDYFCNGQEYYIPKIIESGRNLRCQEKLKDATEVLGKLADLLINGELTLTKDQIYSIFYDLSICSYYVNYNKYKIYTDWFKNYITEKGYTIDDNFSMNLSF